MAADVTAVRNAERNLGLKQHLSAGLYKSVPSSHSLIFQDAVELLCKEAKRLSWMWPGATWSGGRIYPTPPLPWAAHSSV